MRFQDAFLQARSQIAFIAALIVSISMIIWLETRVLEKPLEPSSSQVTLQQLPEELQEYVDDGLQRAQARYDAGEARAGEELLIAIVVAVHGARMPRAEGKARIEAVLETMRERQETWAWRSMPPLLAMTFSELTGLVLEVSPSPLR